MTDNVAVRLRPARLTAQPPPAGPRLAAGPLPCCCAWAAWRCWLDRLNPICTCGGGIPADPHQRPAVPADRGGRVSRWAPGCWCGQPPLTGLLAAGYTPPPRSAPCSSALAWALFGFRESIFAFLRRPLAGCGGDHGPLALVSWTVLATATPRRPNRASAPRGATHRISQSPQRLPLKFPAGEPNPEKENKDAAHHHLARPPPRWRPPAGGQPADGTGNPRWMGWSAATAVVAAALTVAACGSSPPSSGTTPIKRRGPPPANVLKTHDDQRRQRADQQQGLHAIFRSPPDTPSRSNCKRGVREVLAAR